jgi:hypothetical protein
LKRLLVAAAVLAATISAVVPAATAQASPRVSTAWHFDGQIAVAGERGQCWTVYAVASQQPVHIMSCRPGDKFQEWTAISVAGTVVIGLLAHPDFVIGGIPGPGGQVELIKLQNTDDVPLPQSTFVTGLLLRQGKGYNRIKNNAREYISTPQKGRTEYWHRLTPTKAWNAQFDFTGPPTGTGWVAYSAE